MLTIQQREQYDRSAGSPFSRGSADFYYQRGYHPHKLVLPAKRPQFFCADVPTVKVYDLTEEELNAYDAGYADAMAFGETKSW